jgi:hypothetical protein
LTARKWQNISFSQILEKNNTWKRKTVSKNRGLVSSKEKNCIWPRSRREENLNWFHRLRKCQSYVSGIPLPTRHVYGIRLIRSSHVFHLALVDSVYKHWGRSFLNPLLPCSFFLKGARRRKKASFRKIEEKKSNLFVNKKIGERN